MISTHSDGLGQAPGAAKTPQEFANASDEDLYRHLYIRLAELVQQGESSRPDKSLPVTRIEEMASFFSRLACVGLWPTAKKSPEHVAQLAFDDPLWQVVKNLKKSAQAALQRVG